MMVHLRKLLYASLLCGISIGFFSKLQAQDIAFCQEISTLGNIATLRVSAVYTGMNTDEAFASYGLSVYFDETSLDFLSIEYDESLWDECYYELNPFVVLDAKMVDGVNYDQYFYATGADMKPSTEDRRIGTAPVLLFEAKFRMKGSGVPATAVGTLDDATAFYDHYDNTCHDVVIKALDAVQAQVKVFLQGPLAGTMMNTALSPSLLPLSQPYTGAPHNYTGTENVASMPSDIVDWVLVELRDDVTPTMIIGRQAALLKSDGNVVDVTGSMTLTFDGVSPGQYFLAVRHRNHLGIMSSTALNFTSSSN